MKHKRGDCWLAVAPFVLGSNRVLTSYSMTISYFCELTKRAGSMP